MRLDPRSRGWLAPAALTLLAFFLYLPTVTYGFVSYDDTRILLGQPGLFAHSSLAPGVVAIIRQLPREEPLLVRDLTWLVDSLVFGFGNPLGPHLGNVLLYAMLPGLLYGVLRTLGLSLVPSVVATFLFTIHPVHVEPVAWVMGRKDVLSSVFFFGTILAWSASSTSAGTRRWIAFAGSLFLALLALLSKINVIGLPGILLGVTWLKARQQTARRPRQDLLLLIPHLAMALATYGWYQSEVAAWGLLGRGPPLLSSANLYQLLTLIPAQVVTYIDHFFIPWDYGIFYDEPAVGVAVPFHQVVLGWSLVAGAVGGTMIAARRHPVVTFLILATFLTIAPYLNLVYIGIINANRYLLLPSAFGSALVALALCRAYERPPFGRGAAIGVSAVWLVVASVQLARWIPAWQGNESLWRYEMTRAEPSLLAIQAQARVLVRAAERMPPSVERAELVDRARAVVEQGYRRYEALGVQPVEGYYNYQRFYLAKLVQWEGRIAELEGRSLEEVIALFERAFSLSPGRRLLPYLLATRYAALAGRLEEKEAHEQADEAARKSLAMTARYLEEAETAADVYRTRALLERLAYTAPRLQDETRRLAERAARIQIRSPSAVPPAREESD